MSCAMSPVRFNNVDEAIVKVLKEQVPQLTLTCNTDRKDCRFEFWTGELESFFCNLKECTFKWDQQTNQTTTVCNKASCKCYGGRKLCEAGGLDLSEWFGSEEGPVGPGTFHCEENLNLRTCSFSGRLDLCRTTYERAHFTIFWRSLH